MTTATQTEPFLFTYTDWHGDGHVDLLPIDDVHPEFDVDTSVVNVGNAGYTVEDLITNLTETRHLDIPIEVGHVSATDDRIIALDGNHRLAALRRLGATHVPVMGSPWAKHPVNGIRRDTSCD